VNLGVLASTAVALTGPPAFPSAQPWPLSEVRLLDGPFKRAQEINRAYLRRLEPDRLLSHVRALAGLQPKGRPYGGWDAAGSQCIGHYLTAISHMAASTGDTELRERVRYVVAQMAECRKAGGDGHIYTYPSDADYFGKLARGEVPYVHVSPWYIVHKLMAGLRDAYLLCSDARAREVLVGLADWAAATTAKLTPLQWQEMLSREHGGPHETLADLFRITGDRRYLELARKFTHRAVFDPLARGDGSVLTGLHANTQFPKCIGYERIFQVTGEAPWHDAAVAFWRDVTANRTWANGGNSQDEHFFAPAEFPAKLLNLPGPETCNTYNMLRLTRLLFMDRPRAELMDYYERALFNHILASQDPLTGGFYYHTPMRPGHYRMASSPFDCFWCCVNTGMESHSKHGETAYARSADAVYVNLFIASEARWPAMGLTLRQETRFPDEPRTILRLSLTRPRRFTLFVRRPGWVEPDRFRVTVNGRRMGAVQASSGYHAVPRLWKPDDVVRVEMPMRPRAEMLPHSDRWAALFYGPILLAGGLGTDGLTVADFVSQDGDQIPRKAAPVSDSPALVADPARAALGLRRMKGERLALKTHGAMRPADIVLVPLFRLHHQRYAVYWPVRTPEEDAAIRAARAAARREEATLDARTVDRVLIGDAPSEQAHGLRGERTETGNAPWPHAKWRHAAGWFSYDLALPERGAALVRCVFWGGDTGRTFDVLAGSATLATVALDAPRPGEYLVRSFPVPEGAATGRTVRVRFEARPASLAGGLFDLRIVRP